MDNYELQRELTKRGLYTLGIDGILGKGSRKGIDRALKNEGVDYDSWADSRRQIAFEQIVYKEAKIEVGAIDGLVGEQTRYARRVWDDRQDGRNEEETWRDKDDDKVITAPVRKAEDWPRQRDCPRFYGSPGTGHTSLILPRPFRIAWEPSQLVSKVTVHQKCHDAFRAIWFGAHEFYGDEKFRELRLDMYGGCYNNRNIRGGSTKSMHAYACAWDVDPDRNQLRWSKKHASLDDVAYRFFWEIVHEQGGVSLGWLKDYDWMHFQFARL